MAKELSGSGDPARSLEILWGVREPPTRGPKPGLSVGRIVEEAIALADAEGLDAVTMRRVADRLGVGTMSLYTYVPSKAELIDVMLDAAHAEIAGAPAAEAADWRTALERVAHENWRLVNRHPWLLSIATGRPALGPNSLAKYERELGAIEGIGLSDVEMDSVLALVLGHVEGTAARRLEGLQAEQRSGVTDEAWWQANAPLLERLVDASRFPLATRVGTAAGQEHRAAYDADHAFAFGLERLLDGVAALVERRS